MSPVILKEKQQETLSVVPGSDIRRVPETIFRNDITKGKTHQNISNGIR